MQIVELQSLSPSQEAEVLALMGELNASIPVTAQMVRQAVEAPETHFFAALEGPGGPVVGCASLCVFHSPTGTKASVEDVVVSSACRGRGIGRALLEHIIGFARREPGGVDIHLTSRPQRVAANALYRSLGFVQRETNVYLLRI